MLAGAYISSLTAYVHDASEHAVPEEIEITSTVG